MTGDRFQLTNFVNKFLGTVKFGNDHVENILGYGDYQIGNVTISRVYYVEGLGHNLFLVGQFCDSNVEVAFRQHTCFIHNLEGVDLLTGSRGNNMYTLSLGNMMASVDNTLGPVPQRKERCTLQFALSSKAKKSSCFRPFSSTMISPKDIAPIDEVVTPVPAVSTGSPSSTNVDQDAPSPSNSQTTPSSPLCLLLKASKTKSWLWHRRLSHLNFGAINHLARHGLVRGLPKLEFEKDHLCSACAMGKSKKKPHKPKSEDTN
ncbi:integrase, catalytic region, zinc finger, CCHC-type containing protein [Tanacetum coccineum]